MSNLKFYAYPGWGPIGQQMFHYSQAVRIGDRIECSGQGGWDPSFSSGGPDFKTEILEEVDQAFKNVDFCLQDAGGKGFEQVFKVVTYTTDVSGTHEKIMENFRRWMPNHYPIWTELGVKELGAKEMRFEIEVVAFDPQGAK